MKLTNTRFRIRRFAPAVISTGLLFGAATAVQAAPPGGPGDRFPISVEEAEAHRAEIFAGMDSNGDGLISADEFAAAEGPRDHKHGRKPPLPLGHGPDRKPPSETELAAMEDELFEALDTDGNGTLSRSEFSHRAMAEARSESMKSRFFERADANGDGYLSPEEFPPRRLAEFDANGDGQITRDEMPLRPRSDRG